MTTPDRGDREIDYSKVQVSQYLPVGVRYLSVTHEAVRVNFNDGHSEEYLRPQLVKDAYIDATGRVWAGVDGSISFTSPGCEQSEGLTRHIEFVEKGQDNGNA